MGNKKSKFLKKRCPDCREFFLDTIFRKENFNGVVYTRKFIECSECGYSEELKDSHRVSKEVYESEW